MLRRNKDLVIIVIITLIGALLAISGLHHSTWLSIFGILMVFVLPGYLFSQLALPVLPFEERLLVSLGLSIVIVGFSGLLLGLLPVGLTPASWGIWLTLVILVGVYFIWQRRKAGMALPFTLAMPKTTWLAGLSFGLTVILVILALSVAQAGAKQLNAPLTMLWATPDPVNPLMLEVGVRNQEKTAVTYNVVIQQNGLQVSQWADIALEPGASVTRKFAFAQQPTQPVTVLLYRSDQPNQVYRQVKIDFSQVTQPVTGR